MKTVNPNFLSDLLAPLCGSADNDEECTFYSTIDPNNEEEIKMIIKEKLRPYYFEKSIRYRSLAKFSLSYYLTTNLFDFGNIFDTYLIAFEPPNSPKLFFIWLWEVLFNNSNYKMKDINNIKISNYIHEVREISSEHRKMK